ncbi:MAG: bifunctional FO biosynthesis protein CofGH [Jiangellales bacterium]
MTSLLSRPPTRSALRRALRRAADGVTLDAVEAETLLHARGDDLVALCESAARVRDAGLADAGRPGVVTYSRKVFVPLSRLCRDRCHYCTFATVPHRLDAPFLSPDEVLDIARAGAALGCKEALFTLGDRPEDRWAQARDWLESRGYDSALAYLRAMAVLVLEETGLLPHLNPGVMSWEEMARLRPVAASMGMMLETTSRVLFSQPGGVHYGSPDKDPAVRLRVLADSGRLAIPFTTGVLVGIGETYADRVESLRQIRAVAREFGHVQEVLVQNFRSKPDTAMRHADDLPADEHLAAIAVARLLLGPRMRVQVPPNLSEPGQIPRLLAAGADDWGGVSPVTADHVNPERPWPTLDSLAELSRQAGFRLAERLAVQPEWATEAWLDPRVVPHVNALAGSGGLADPGAVVVGRPWQEPDSDWGSTGRVDLAAAIDTQGRRTERRSDFSEVYGDWSVLREKVDADAAEHATAPRIDGDVLAALRSAERNPAALTDDEAVVLAQADGPALDALVALADSLRRDTVGDTVTYVVTRNLNFTNVCYTGCRFCAFAQRRTDADAFTLSLSEVGDRVDDAVAAGATEICMQGGIHPDLPGTAYFDLAREVKRRAPTVHLHAFSPMEVVNGATRTGLSIREFLVALREAGVGSIPGTAAEILDDDVRWVLTKGKLPTATWIEVVSTAHEVGLRSSSTMMYGHVDQPRHWVTHLRTLARIQARTGGFTEFVALPFVHQSSPIYLAGVARPGPTERDNLAVHALARVMLHGLVPNIQTSWVKMGVEGTRAMLQAGANDLGGTLMEETISRMAGSQHGSSKTPEELAEIAWGIGRPVRERTTTYGSVLRSASVVPTRV